MSNSKYQEALDRLLNDEYDFPHDFYGEDKASAFDKDVDMIEQLIEEHFKPKELSDSNDELRRQLYFIEPYKFEDLKPNMWVWDIETNFIYQIFDTHEEDMSIEVVINDRDIQHLKVVTLCKFEENRFFPVQCDNPES